VGHCWVGSVVFSNRDANGRRLTCSFSHKEIMEMQCELLVSNFKDPKTIGLVKDNIGRISDGSSSHCAGALKLGMKKAFEKKRGVKLRCNNCDHIWNNSSGSYSSIGSRVYCQNCGGKRYLRCVGCGSDRTSNYSESCQGCGKRFM